LLFHKYAYSYGDCKRRAFGCEGAEGSSCPSGVVYKTFFDLVVCRAVSQDSTDQHELLQVATAAHVPHGGLKLCPSQRSELGVLLLCGDVCHALYKVIQCPMYKNAALQRFRHSTHPHAVKHAGCSLLPGATR
jgi:hypothetical protein